MILTAQEVEDMVWDGDIVSYQEGAISRWTRRMTGIVKISGSHYSIQWNSGLTEDQEDEYWDQKAPEVFPVEVTRTGVEYWSRNEIEECPPELKVVELKIDY